LEGAGSRGVGGGLMTFARLRRASLFLLVFLMHGGDALGPKARKKMRGVFAPGKRGVRRCRVAQRAEGCGVRL
jgi:hypothetical protein